jgi:CRP-like cAMP-binding protein
MKRTDPSKLKVIPGRTGHSRNPWVAKLSCFVALSDDDIGLLETLCAREERIPARVSLAEEGNAPTRGFVVTRGLAYRYRDMRDGRRQILTFIIPGDFFGLHAFLRKSIDYSIITLTPTRLARIERAQLIEIVEHHPRIVAALWCHTMQEAAVLRERVVRLGRGNAHVRIAYLFCEFLWRYRAVGLGEGEDHTLSMPLTQVEIADTLGLTAVHVNRVLQDFRREGVITLARRRLTLHRLDQLQHLAGCSQDYLHLTDVPAATERFLADLERREVRG